jgi:hypothetical protein
VEFRVLQEDYSSEWASLFPSFAIPKKNRTIRQYELLPISGSSSYCWNIECQPFPTPKIGKVDMVCSMEGSTSASALYLKMGYYHIKIDADAQTLCAIVFP